MNELPSVRALLGFLILTAMLVVGVAWLPLDLTIDRLLYEDFFYYLQVATHISRGNGATLDGVAPTNGFHPLWMLATTLAVQMGGREIAPHIMLSIAGLLHVCQAAMIFFLLRPLTSQPTAALAAIFFATNYRLLACNMSGLETPLQGVLVLSVFGLLGPWRQRPGWTTSMATGALLGLSVLARFDLLLLAAAATAWLVLIPRDSEPAMRRVMFACAVGCVAVVLLVPWFVWSQAHSGSWLPNSKRALELWLFDPPHLDRPLQDQANWLIQKTVSTSSRLADTANALGLWPLANHWRVRIGGPLVGSLAIFIAIWVVAHRKGPWGSWRLFLLGYSALHARVLHTLRAPRRALLIPGYPGDRSFVGPGSRLLYSCPWREPAVAGGGRMRDLPSLCQQLALRRRCLAQEAGCRHYACCPPEPL